MTKEEVLAVIATKLEVANNLLRECEQLANEHKVDFYTPWGGEGTHQAGIGGKYDGEDRYWESSSGWC